MDGSGTGTGRRMSVGGFLRRVPFTTFVVVLMLILAVSTGTLWSSIQTRPWFTSVAFGLPGLVEGRPWTVVSGAFFGLIPVYYVLVTGLFAVIVGLTEWRVGTARTMVTTIGGHLVGVLGCALFLHLFRGTGWSWAADLATQYDVGTSAGMMAALVVLSTTIRPPWGLRIRVGAIAYPVVSLLTVGLMADVEHLIAVLVVLPFATRLAGRHAVPQDPPDVRERRLLLGVGVAVLALRQLVVPLIDQTGPTGAAEPLAGGLGWHLAACGAGLAVAALLVLGYRTGYVLALAWTAVAVGLAGWAVVVRATSSPAENALWWQLAPSLLATGILGVLLALLLVPNRRAFSRPLTGASGTGSRPTARSA